VPGSLTTRTASAKIQVNAPPYIFVSLNQPYDNHTLLVQLGGHLTVTDPVYVNSCSTANGFDLFGTGGNLSAPSISTVGGWEIPQRQHGHGQRRHVRAAAGGDDPGLRAEHVARLPSRSWPTRSRAR
jgi:hypothetical protein